MSPRIFMERGVWFSIEAITLCIMLTLSQAKAQERAKDPTGTSAPSGSVDPDQQFLIEIQTKSNGYSNSVKTLGVGGAPAHGFGYYWERNERWWDPGIYVEDPLKFNSTYLQSAIDEQAWAYGGFVGKIPYASSLFGAVGASSGSREEDILPTINSTSYKGRIVQSRFRISAVSKDHPPFNTKVLKVTRTGSYQTVRNYEALPVIALEPLQVELLSGVMTTDWMELKLPLVEGSETAVSLLPVEVSWKAIDGFDNVDDHIDPWTKPIYGKRIFPDFKNPDDTEIRHKLEVIVKTSPALFGKAVFVKAFDVDDSTSESFDVDENGTAPVIDTIGIPGAGDDNLPDYLNTPKDGQFWTGSAWGDQTAQGTVDANGETKFIFRVGMQPGSNYRVVASVNDEAMYAGVQTSNPAAAKYLGPEANRTGGTAASPLLTVWRRLWVENDSMKAPGLHADGYLKNDLTSDVSSPTVKNSLIANGETIVQFLPVITDQSSLRNLENGTFILPPSGVYNQFIAFANNGPLGDGVTISGAHPEIQPGQPFRLYDDDDFGLNRAPLPRNDLIDDVVQNLYKTGFIEVVNAANFKGQDYNNDKYVEFHQNHPCVVHPLNPFAQRLVWEDAKNLSDSNLLWVANLVAGYQNESNRDFDPKTEEFDEGLTPAATRRYSIVYVEAVRDMIDGSFRNPSQNNSSLNDEIFKNMKLTAAHEIGHMPGTDPDIHHTEGHLMGDGGYGNEGQYFTPATLLRFRKTNKWQQP